MKWDSFVEEVVEIADWSVEWFMGFLLITLTAPVWIPVAVFVGLRRLVRKLKAT